jgi:small-conductance mechanosensitive channel
MGFAGRGDLESLQQYFASLDLKTGWMPDWGTSLILLGVSVFLALWLHSMMFSIVERLVSEQDLFRRSLVARMRGPSRLALIMLGIAVAAAVAPLSWQQTAVIWHVMLVGGVVLIGWSVSTAMHIWTVIYLRRFKLDSEDNLLARKHVTQSRILERIAKILIVIVTFAAALMTFSSVRQYGVSLLASAGAASLVVGLALQPMLKNLIAGIQLAVTQPIRIDDALLVENEWGNVEEITSSYVVVRLWDWRRMIVPLSYFIEQPFQNWTREGAALIGTVFLYTDFTVPVGEVRSKLEQVAKESPIWDGRVVNLQVTDFKENTMELRMLVSAKDAPRTFDLRCEVREKMIAWLQERYPQALPRVRADIAEGARGSDKMLQAPKRAKRDGRAERAVADLDS